MAPYREKTNQRLAGAAFPDVMRLTFDSSVDVSVIEDDEGRVSARFDGHPSATVSVCNLKVEKSNRTHFFIPPAAMPYNSLATGVLPVNVIFLTVLCAHISRPTSETFFSVVMTFMTPGGTPARAPSCAGTIQIN